MTCPSKRELERAVEKLRESGTGRATDSSADLEGGDNQQDEDTTNAVAEPALADD